jgi:hypothetical protein
MLTNLSSVSQEIKPKLDSILKRGRKDRLSKEDQERYAARRQEVKHFYDALLDSEGSEVNSRNLFPNILDVYLFPTVAELLADNREEVTQDKWNDSLADIKIQLHQTQITTRATLVRVVMEKWELEGSSLDARDGTNDDVLDAQNMAFLSRAIAVFQCRACLRPFSYPEVIQHIHHDEDHGVEPIHERVHFTQHLGDVVAAVLKDLGKDLNVVKTQELYLSSYLYLRCPKKQRVPMSWADFVRIRVQFDIPHVGSILTFY